MPLVAFETLPETARVWVFGAAAPITGAAAERMLAAVDTYLAQWKAHGAPLYCARDWRDDRFLAVAVDEAATGASGCSIDGMFRVLADIESHIGTSLVGGGAVFWRDLAGAVVAGDRPSFRAAAAMGNVTEQTPVFDTTIASVGAWRNAFERTAHTSWHGKLLAR